VTDTPTAVPTATATRTPVTLVALAPLVIPTDWVTYIDASGKFAFYHPPSWKTLKADEDYVIFNVGDPEFPTVFSIVVTTSLPGLSLSDPDTVMAGLVAGVANAVGAEERVTSAESWIRGDTRGYAVETSGHYSSGGSETPSCRRVEAVWLASDLAASGVYFRMNTSELTDLGRTLVRDVISSIRRGSPSSSQVASTVLPAPSPTPQLAPTRVRAEVVEPAPSMPSMSVDNWEIRLERIATVPALTALGMKLKAAGRFAILFFAVTNRGLRPDTFVAFGTVDIQDGQGRRFQEDPPASGLAQWIYETDIGARINPDDTVHVAAAFDISQNGEFYVLIPGILAKEYSGRIEFQIP